MAWRSLGVALFGLMLAAVATSAHAQNVTAAAAVQRASNQPIDDVIRDAPTSHPAALMLLAQRLVEAGRRDEAMFWYYAGQVRWRARVGEVAHAQERSSLRRLFEQVGPSINVYAFCDMDAFAQMVDRVIAWDNAHPDGTSAALKTETQDGLRELVTYARANSGEIDREQCVAPSVDPYVGSGGAIMGRPNEMVQPYDPARFAGFEIGTTTGDQIIAALGAPEWWENDAGTTVFGYSYLRAFMPGFMSQRVSVSFTLDGNRVLREIRLPRED